MRPIKHFYLFFLLLLLFGSCASYTVAPNIPNFFTRKGQANLNIGLNTLGLNGQLDVSLDSSFYLKAGFTNSIGLLGGSTTGSKNWNIGLGHYKGSYKRIYRQVSLDYFQGNYSSSEPTQSSFYNTNFLQHGLLAREIIMFRLKNKETNWGLNFGIGGSYLKQKNNFELKNSFKRENVYVIGELGLNYSTALSRYSNLLIGINSTFLGLQGYRIQLLICWTLKVAN